MAPLVDLIEQPRYRALIAGVIGVPVTLAAAPFIIGGLAAAGAVPSLDLYSLEVAGVLLVLLLAVFGLAGLVAAWLRLFRSRSYLAAHPKARRAIAITLGLGIVSAGGLAILMLLPMWPASLFFSAVAFLGWLLLEASCET